LLLRRQVTIGEVLNASTVLATTAARSTTLFVAALIDAPGKVSPEP
jgi:hypothetical protein